MEGNPVRGEVGSPVTVLKSVATALRSAVSSVATFLRSAATWTLKDIGLNTNSQEQGHQNLSVELELAPHVEPHSSGDIEEG